MEIKDRVKKLRLLKGMTLDGLAGLAGCSKTRVWEIENNADIKPSASLLRDIAISLDTTLDFLMGDEAQVDAIHSAFFNRYMKLKVADRSRLRNILKILE